MSADIKGAQESLVHFSKHYKLHFCDGLKANGKKGAETKHALMLAKYLLGYGKKARHDGTIKSLFVRRLRHPHTPFWFPPHMYAVALSRRRKWKKDHAGGIGKKIVAAGAPYVGKHETGSNDGPWLRDVEAWLVRHGEPLGWMIPGNPYCGMGVIYECLRGAGLKVPANWVGTTNICPSAGRRYKAADGNTYKLVRVSASKAREGSILVFNFGSGGAKHTGVARGKPRGGQVPTREWNTSPGNGGSQSNGGGVYDRWRSFGLLLCVLNWEKV